MKHYSGIYEILNTVNGKRYIGQASKFSERWRKHRKMLRKNAHHSSKLQAAWNKYGEESFKFNVLIICATKKEILNLYEQRCLDVYKPFYNVSPTAGSPLGMKHSATALAKIREIAATRVGVPLPDSHREAISKGKTGLKRAPFSDTWRANMSVTRKGRKKSPAAILKLAESLRGKKRAPFSIEWRRKLGEANLGRKHSAAARVNMSKAQRGRKCAPYSKERCEKHSRDMKMYWEQVRNGQRERK